MNKKEVYEAVSNLVYGDRHLTIDSKYDLWETFSYEIVWNAIRLTLMSYNDIREFRRLMQDNEAKSPSFDWLDYESSIELLFTHYKWGHTNWSNCILVNEHNDVLAISWNGQNNTTEIISAGLKNPWYIVLNKVKKLSIEMKTNELEKYSEWLTDYCRSLSQKEKKI